MPTQPGSSALTYNSYHLPLLLSRQASGEPNTLPRLSSFVVRQRNCCDTNVNMLLNMKANLQHTRIHSSTTHDQNTSKKITLTIICTRAKPLLVQSNILIPRDCSQILSTYLRRPQYVRASNLSLSQLFRTVFELYFRIRLSTLCSQNASTRFSEQMTTLFSHHPQEVGRP
jgi:hypothetical protein